MLKHNLQNTCRQAKYEWKKKQLPDKDIIKSLQILQKRCRQQSSKKEIRGYIQNFNVFPLLLGLWTEEDVDVYHEQVKHYPLIVDATCGVASKVNESRVYYYPFIFYNRNVETEPVPFLEILTDQPDEMCLTNALNYFLGGEKRKYGPNCGRKPLVVICDFSWPIIKCMLSAFNHKSLEGDINDCYTIVSSTAAFKDLPQGSAFTVIHLKTFHKVVHLL